MKIKKLVASVLATAIGFSAMAISSSASLISSSQTENANVAAPNNAYLVAGKEGIDYSKVAKIEFDFTIDTDNFNGTVGTSVGGTWTTNNYTIEAAGKHTVSLDGLSGIDSEGDDGSLKADVAQVQMWWSNAGSFTLDAYRLLDASGAVLDTSEATTPDTSTPDTDDDSDADTDADTDTGADDKDPGNADTSDAGIVALIALSAVAATGLVVAKKRK